MMKKMIVNRRSVMSATKNRATRGLDFKVSDIPDLIFEQEWTLMRHLFTFRQEDVLEYLENRSGYNAENLLHWVCRFHPPLDVLQSIYVFSPESVQQVDRQGRYPLHTAVKYGASLAIISFLLKKYKPAARAQDSAGRTPLHLVSQHYIQNYDVESLRSDSIPGGEQTIIQIELVRILCLAAPGSVNLEDRNGVSALEMALECDAPLKVIKELQKTSEKEWKALQDSKPGPDHDTFDKKEPALTIGEEKRGLKVKDETMRKKHLSSFFIKPRRGKQFRAANAA